MEVIQVNLEVKSLNLFPLFYFLYWFLGGGVERCSMDSKQQLMRILKQYCCSSYWEPLCERGEVRLFVFVCMVFVRLFFFFSVFLYLDFFCFMFVCLFIWFSSIDSLIIVSKWRTPQCIQQLCLQEFEKEDALHAMFHVSFWPWEKFFSFFSSSPTPLHKIEKLSIPERSKTSKCPWKRNSW